MNKLLEYIQFFRIISFRYSLMNWWSWIFSNINDNEDIWSWLRSMTWFIPDLSDDNIPSEKSSNTFFRSFNQSGSSSTCMFSNSRILSSQFIVDFVFPSQFRLIIMFCFFNSVIYIYIFSSISFSFVSFSFTWYYNIFFVLSISHTIPAQSSLFIFIFISPIHFFFRKIISILMSTSFIFVATSLIFSVYIIRRIIHCLFPDFFSVLEASCFLSSKMQESFFPVESLNIFALFIFKALPDFLDLNIIQFHQIFFLSSGYRFIYGFVCWVIFLAFLSSDFLSS